MGNDKRAADYRIHGVIQFENASKLPRYRDHDPADGLVRYLLGGQITAEGLSLQSGQESSPQLEVLECVIRYVKFRAEHGRHVCSGVNLHSNAWTIAFGQMALHRSELTHRKLLSERKAF